eukprot:gene30545-35573_t
MKINRAILLLCLACAVAFPTVVRAGPKFADLFTNCPGCQPACKDGTHCSCGQCVPDTCPPCDHSACDNTRCMPGYRCHCGECIWDCDPCKDVKCPRCQHCEDGQCVDNCPSCDRITCQQGQICRYVFASVRPSLHDSATFVDRSPPQSASVSIRVVSFGFAFAFVCGTCIRDPALCDPGMCEKVKCDPGFYCLCGMCIPDCDPCKNMKCPRCGKCVKDCGADNSACKDVRCRPGEFCMCGQCIPLCDIKPPCTWNYCCDAKPFPCSPIPLDPPYKYCPCDTKPPCVRNPCCDRDAATTSPCPLPPPPTGTKYCPCTLIVNPDIAVKLDLSARAP